MWRCLVLMLFLGVLYAEVTGRQNEEFAIKAKVAKHTRLRRAVNLQKDWKAIKPVLQKPKANASKPDKKKVSASGSSSKGFSGKVRKYGKNIKTLVDVLHQEPQTVSGSIFQRSIAKLKKYGEPIMNPARQAKAKALNKPNPAKLNDDQRMAIYLYTMHSSFYKLLNSKLREGRDAGEFQDYVDLLMSALKKIGKSGPLTVWRVLNVHVNYKNKELVKWPAFTSTSTVRGRFSVKGTNTTLFEIKNAFGYRIKAYSAVPSEEEVLLPTNTSIKVCRTPVIIGTQMEYVVEMKSTAVSVQVSSYAGVCLSTFIIISYVIIAK